MATLPLRSDVPLGPRTTLGVGGPARHFLTADDEATLRAGAAWARDAGLPLFLLGDGSNLLVADEGFPGLVIDVALRGVTRAADGPWAEVTAAAGEPWDAVVADTVARGLAGVECLSGIPGRVGAAPIQNIGAYGQELADCATRIAALDLQDGGRRVDLPAEACDFAYRDSRFKRTPGRYAVVSATLRLRIGGPPTVRYGELARQLGEAPADLARVREKVLSIRRDKSMVIDPEDPNRRSAGSFFLNPVVESATAETIAAQTESPVPRWPAPEGRVKLSAAWLIERAGLHRGYGRGRVGLSSRHTLAVVNRGDATAREVIALAAEVRRRVRAVFEVDLEPEPVGLGFDAPLATILDGL